MAHGQPPPPGWVSVVSTNVDAIKWTPDRSLHVRFLRPNKKGQKHYRYWYCNGDVYWDALKSSSKGRFVIWVLTPTYNYAPY